MATYSSYKMIDNSQITDASIPASAVQSGSFSNWCVNGCTVIHVTAHLAAVAIGKFLLE